MARHACHDIAMSCGACRVMLNQYIMFKRHTHVVRCMSCEMCEVVSLTVCRAMCRAMLSMQCMSCNVCRVMLNQCIMFK